MYISMYTCAYISYSQKSASFTVTSVTGVLTIQNHIKICNKYLKNWLGN